MLQFILVLAISTQCIDNGVGLTPAMGWNSWNHFGCHINETLIKQTADLLVETGLSDKGYVYVNLDDCWQVSRDPVNQTIIEDKEAFPSGMKELGSYIHSKKLKFGVYSDAGTATCAGRPGSRGYETQDAKTYAEWEVDYLKYDNCNAPKNETGIYRYYLMSKALNESGRHIYYSLCSWGTESVWEWGTIVGNSWRTTGDIQDSWSSVLGILDQQVGLEQFSGIGGWNDPDMLEVGNGKLTPDEELSHFALWCLLKSPLLIGCDLSTMTDSTLSILGNEELIAINQDPLGEQAARVKREGSSEIWGGELFDQEHGKYVVLFLNRGDGAANITVDLFVDLKLQFDSYEIRDVVNHADLGTSSEQELTLEVKKHSVAVVTLLLHEEGKPRRIRKAKDAEK